ncbi:RNA-binding protein 8A-like [Artemia franciscana]|uniref:RNA-binding protein 8A-like n=1 Tax=Artemia franciscana TaxID=6661 RepID=UPI0032DA3CDF
MYHEFYTNINYSSLEGIQKLKEKAKVKKGRGFVDSGKPDRDVGGFEAMETEGEGDEPGPQRCNPARSEIATSSTPQDEISTKIDIIHFDDHNVQQAFNLEITNRFEALEVQTTDEKTPSLDEGWGYPLVEYETYKEASAAIDALNGSTFLDQKILVNWAFVKGPKK